jgi:hypothetical protein
MNRQQIAVFLLAAMGVAGCEKDGPLERAGEEIDEAAEDIQVEGETPANQVDDAIDEIERTAEDVLE